LTHAGGKPGGTGRAGRSTREDHVHTLSGIPLIKSVMTPFPHTVDVDASLREARSTMVEHEIRHLPVTREGKLVGLLTDRDLKRALDPRLGLPSGNELTVGDVCVFDPYVVPPTAPLDEVLAFMTGRHIGSALVARDERVIGIFTANDACRLFSEHLRALFPRGGGGAA